MNAQPRRDSVVTPASDAPWAITAAGLQRAFGEMWAVRGLELSIPRGELFGLVGPDGAGKTTTLRMLAGILPPTAGDAEVAGYPIPGGEELVKARIGYMSQRFGLYADLSVEENLRFYADLYEVPRSERLEAEERLLGFSNLTPFRKRLAGNLSGGMKQKLGLACALVHKPEVLLLDEPTNGVDPVSRRDFWRILHRMLKEGVTILVATAYLDEAERCERVGLMEQGRLIQVDTPRHLKSALAGRLFELEVDAPRRAREVLVSALGSERVSQFGERLHLYADGKKDIEHVLDRLAGQSIKVNSVRPIAASLEDVFIHQLTHRSSSGGGHER